MKEEQVCLECGEAWGEESQGWYCADEFHLQERAPQSVPVDEGVEA